VIHCKTGALFGAAARLGALAADADPPLCDAAFAFGARVGEAYQIADDIADFVLAPAAWHAGGAAAALREAIVAFLAQRGEPPPGADGSFAALRPGLEREIDRRIAQAQAALAEFPASDPVRLLRAAPRYIVGLQ
jgi:hypothetical protein